MIPFNHIVFGSPVGGSISKKVYDSIQAVSSFLYAKDFPGNGDEQIVNAINASIDGGTVQLEGNTTYIIDNTIFINKSVTVKGATNTILKRSDYAGYKLAVAADSTSTQLTLNTVSGIKTTFNCVGIVVGQADNEKSGFPWVTSIDGNTVKFNGAIGGIPYTNNTVYPIGSNVIKPFSLFQIGVYTPYQATNVVFKDIIFDGNKENNSLSHSWSVNMGIFSRNTGRTVIESCKFLNSPNETIVGHNFDIRNNIFKDLNGSIFHASIDKPEIDESMIVTNFTGNIASNTNMIPSSITGHSEAAFTTSNSGGYVNIIGNRVINVVNGAVIGLLYPSVSNADWGTSNYLVTSNIFDGAATLVAGLFTENPGTFKNIFIKGNSIRQIPFDSRLPSLLSLNPDTIIEQTS